jgi:phosphoribosylformimino-5-aminoimidazole carboxamide ribotide isomerase
MFAIIPAIDIRDGRCVRLQQGDYDRQTTYEATPVQMARTWAREGAPLIHLVDLDGAKEGRPVNKDAIREICAAISVPCELGGGIRTKFDVQEALKLGVRQVILGTAVVETPEIVADLLDELSADQLVAGIDARDGMVAVHGWLDTSSIEALELAKQLAGMGIKRIIYTDIRTDGMFTGPNTEAVAVLCDALPGCLIVASGGVGEPGHVRDLVDLRRPNLAGVIVGKALYDGRVTYAELLAAVG